MKHVICIFVLGSLAALAGLFSGCSNLRPETSSPRYFLLVPAQTPEGGRATNTTQTPDELARRSGLVLAVAPIKLPEYLAKKSLVTRKSAWEIEYLESVLWAERLDEGFLRVLKASLARQLPGHTVRAAPRKGDLELQLTILQFDVSTAGEGVLAADWRIISSAEDKTIKEGRFQTFRKGSNPKRAPDGAISMLSALIDDLAGALAEVIR